MGVKGMDAKHNSAWLNQFLSSGAVNQIRIKSVKYFGQTMADFILQVGLGNEWKILLSRKSGLKLMDAKREDDGSGFSLVGELGAPIMTLSPSIKALSPHKNFLKTIGKTISYCSKQQSIVKNLPTSQRPRENPVGREILVSTGR